MPAGMDQRISSRPRAIRVALLVLSTLLIVACANRHAAGSASAQTLLKQTFSATHKVGSGIVDFSLSVDLVGSSPVRRLLSLSLGGPFQSRGSGRLPETNLTLTVSALGHQNRLGVVSAGAHAYFIFQGSAYRLPAAAFRRLEQSFLGASGAGGSRGLAPLGIAPLHWLRDPSIVGPDAIGGAMTTRIRAGVDVFALLSDLSPLLHRAAVSGATGPAAILRPSSPDGFAGAARHSTAEVWTGRADHTLRRLAVRLDLPVTGRTSAQPGGLGSTRIAFTVQYAGLNQPQAITAPATARPSAELTGKLRLRQPGSGALGSTAPFPGG